MEAVGVCSLRWMQKYFKEASESSHFLWEKQVAEGHLPHGAWMLEQADFYHRLLNCFRLHSKCLHVNVVLIIFCSFIELHSSTV